MKWLPRIADWFATVCLFVGIFMFVGAVVSIDRQLRRIALAQDFGICVKAWEVGMPDAKTPKVCREMGK